MRTATIILFSATLVARAQVFKELPSFTTIPAGKSSPVTNRPASLNSGSNTNSSPDASGSSYAADDKYKIRVGDRLGFKIVEDRYWEKSDRPALSLVVTDAGEVDVPYIRHVQAANKTCKQLSDEIKALLEKEHYYKATVELAIDAASRVLGRIYVFGLVRNPGAVDMLANENLTVSKAIIRQGGFADFANGKKVKVVRPPSEKSSRKLEFEVNVVEIMEKGKTEKDIILQADDIIIVPEKSWNF